MNLAAWPAVPTWLRAGPQPTSRPRLGVLNLTLGTEAGFQVSLSRPSGPAAIPGRFPRPQRPAQAPGRVQTPSLPGPHRGLSAPPEAFRANGLIINSTAAGYRNCRDGQAFTCLRSGSGFPPPGGSGPLRKDKVTRFTVTIRTHQALSSFQPWSEETWGGSAPGIAPSQGPSLLHWGR